jgi:adenylate kinase family enzyme
MCQRMLSRGRADDNLDTIKKRFQTNQNETQPVICVLEKENLVKVNYFNIYMVVINFFILNIIFNIEENRFK